VGKQGGKNYRPKENSSILLNRHPNFRSRETSGKKILASVQGGKKRSIKGTYRAGIPMTYRRKLKRERACEKKLLEEGEITGGRHHREELLCKTWENWVKGTAKPR